MPRPAAIFDLDGTLVDTISDIANAVNHCLMAINATPHPTSAYPAFVGWGIRRTLTLAAPPDADLDALEAMFQQHYRNHLVVQSRPYPGILSMLQALHAAEVPMGVLSNKPEPLTRTMVSQLFPSHLFQSVAGARPDTPRKPSPVAVTRMLEVLGTKPAACWFVGDTAVDIETARRAGLHPIGVSWGFRDAETLRDAGAEHIITTPAELIRIMGIPLSP